MLNDTAPLTPLFEQLAKDLALYWNKIGTEEILLFIESFLSQAMSHFHQYESEGLRGDPRPQLLRYLLYEFLLILFTKLITNRRYEDMNLLINRQFQIHYYVKQYKDTVAKNIPINTYNYFPLVVTGNAGIEHKQARARLLDFISKRLSSSKITDLVETDLLLSLITYIKKETKTGDFRWTPFITPSVPKLRLFHLMESRSRFDEAKILFQIDEPEELANLWDKFFYNVWWGHDMSFYDTSYQFGSIP